MSSTDAQGAVGLLFLRGSFTVSSTIAKKSGMCALSYPLGFREVSPFCPCDCPSPASDPVSALSWEGVIHYSVPPDVEYLLPKSYKREYRNSAWLVYPMLVLRASNSQSSEGDRPAIQRGQWQITTANSFHRGHLLPDSGLTPEGQDLVIGPNGYRNHSSSFFCNGAASLLR